MTETAADPTYVKSFLRVYISQVAECTTRDNVYAEMEHVGRIDDIEFGGVKRQGNQTYKSATVYISYPTSLGLKYCQQAYVRMDKSKKSSGFEKILIKRPNGEKSWDCLCNLWNVDYWAECDREQADIDAAVDEAEQNAYWTEHDAALAMFDEDECRRVGGDCDSAYDPAVTRHIIEYNTVSACPRSADPNSVSANRFAGAIIADHIKADTHVNWLCVSRNPGAMNVILANLDKVNWEWLSMNEAAISLLIENSDKICWKNAKNYNANISLLYDAFPEQQ